MSKNIVCPEKNVSKSVAAKTNIQFLQLIVVLQQKASCKYCIYFKSPSIEYSLVPPMLMISNKDIDLFSVKVSHAPINIADRLNWLKQHKQGNDKSHAKLGFKARNRLLLYGGQCIIYFGIWSSTVRWKRWGNHKRYQKYTMVYHLGH